MNAVEALGKGLAVDLTLYTWRLKFVPLVQTELCLHMVTAFPGRPAQGSHSEESSYWNQVAAAPMRNGIPFPCGWQLSLLLNPSSHQLHW